MTKYKLEYCEEHWYHNYLDDRWFGGGVICTHRKLFDTKSEAREYAEDHKYMWSPAKEWNNQSYNIIEIKI